MNRRLRHEGRMYNNHFQISEIGTMGCQNTPSGVGVSRRDPPAHQKVRILRAHGDPRGNGLHQETDAPSLCSGTLWPTDHYWTVIQQQKGQQWVTGHVMAGCETLCDSNLKGIQPSLHNPPGEEYFP